MTMAAESMLALIEDVIKQEETKLNDVDFVSKREEEESLRRYEAAEFLRKKVGVVVSKDLPAQPSDHDFRLGLRSGIILSTALNKVQPGTVPKASDVPSDIGVVSDGGALIAYQHFENLKNFLAAVEDLGLPTFDPLDLEQGGQTSQVVNCVLALKALNDKKIGTGKPPTGSKSIGRRNSEPHMQTISGTSSISERSVDTSYSDIDYTDMSNSRSNVSAMVRTLLVEKDPDEIPNVVEYIINKVMEEFERRLANQTELVKTTAETLSVLGQNMSLTESPEAETHVRNVTPPESPKAEAHARNLTPSESPKTGTHARNVTQPESPKAETRSWNRFRKESPKTETKSENISPIELRNISPIESPEAEAQSQNVSPKELFEAEAQSEHVSLTELPKAKTQNEERTTSKPVKETNQLSEEEINRRYILREKVESRLKSQRKVVEKQNSHVQELKLTVHATKESMNLLQTKYREEFASLGKHLHSLGSAAAGYKKVLEENRKLYNQIQDLKGNIRVYCRVRPFLPGQKSGSTTVDNIEEGTITIATPSKNGKDAKKSFTFNKVFGAKATQAEVFKDMQPLVRSVLDGYNVCIFAYGQTGAGKTFTMTGPNNPTEETFGVNYRALNDLFLIAEQRKQTIAYEVSVQMMEIYNEQVRDLLTPDGSIKKLDIRNHSQNGINVPDANMLPVTTTTDVINLMNLGHNNRAACSTAMNERSSRSHSCMTVHVHGKDLASGGIVRGCMHLVDLAGSERVDKSEVTGDRLKEAQHINKSLAALGDVIAALASKNNHVPYRNSKLTQLLQDSLGGQAKTLMFMNMSPEVDSVGETISTLKFAERVSSVELGSAKSNKDGGGGGGGADVKDLKEQIANLKAALARKDDEIALLVSSTPDTMSLRSNSTASSPIHPTWRPTKDASPGAPKDASNKGKTGSTHKPQRGGSEPEDILTNEAEWPPLSVVKEGITKSSSMHSDDNQDREVRSMKYGSATPDEIDELDMANSDSESDVQVSVPKVLSLPAETGSKIKKPQARAPARTKSPEKKSLIPTLTSRKITNGASTPAAKKGASIVNRKTK